MKKFLVLALVAMISATGFSKTIDEVFNAFPKADNVQEMTIDKAMLAMAGVGDKAAAMKDVDAMRVIAIENPTSDQVAIAQEIMKEGVEGFDVLVRTANRKTDKVALVSGGGSGHPTTWLPRIAGAAPLTPSSSTARR